MEVEERSGSDRIGSDRENVRSVWLVFSNRSFSARQLANSWAGFAMAHDAQVCNENEKRKRKRKREKEKSKQADKHTAPEIIGILRQILQLHHS